MRPRHEADDATLADDSQQQAADRCITTAELAELLQIAPITLHQWRVRGKGPAFLRFGRQIRYRLADVRAYMDASRIGGSRP